MTFVQIIDCATDRVDDLNRLMDRWVDETRGRRTATHSIIGRDRANAAHVVEIVEFPSYEDAIRNSQLPETDRIFQEIVALCEEPPKFTDLDIVRDEQLNKQTARRFFSEVASAGNLDRLEELVTSDYVHHDPASREEVVGVEALRRMMVANRAAFDVEYTVDDQLAEGDTVVTRWTMTGTHIGEYMGVAPTEARITVTGISIFRFREGMIAEGWSNWDTLGLLGQLDAVEL